MGKIVFFIESNLTKRDFIRFGVKFFLKKKINVEIFNVTPLTRPKYYKNYKSKDKFKYKDEKIFLKKDQVISKIRELNSNDIVIVLLGINPKTKFIIETLGEAKVKFGYYSFGLLPIPSKNILEILRLSFFYPLSALYQLWHRIKIYKLNSLPPPNFICCAGKKTYLYYKNVNQFTKIIKIPSLDYDKYLQLKKIKNKKKSKKKEKYIVYIDSYLSHPDQLYEKYFPPEKMTNFKDYYDPINNFFKQLKKHSNLKVKIAAHPRSIYKKNPYNFGKLYEGQSAELIKDCQFVVAKASLAINYAVLFKKPIIFLLNDFCKYNTKSEIIHVSKYFKQEPINITNLDNENFNFLKKRKINYLVYKNFTKDFLNNVNDSKKKYLSYEILLNNIIK